MLSVAVELLMCR